MKVVERKFWHKEFVYTDESLCITSHIFVGAYNRRMEHLCFRIVHFPGPNVLPMLETPVFPTTTQS